MRRHAVGSFRGWHVALLVVLALQFQPAVAGDHPIALSRVLVRDGNSYFIKFVARGSFTLPDPLMDDPRNDGGGLLAFYSNPGSTGNVEWVPLVAGSWKGLGPNEDGSRGFKYIVRPGRRVVVKESRITAKSYENRGNLSDGHDGPMYVILTIGKGTTRYCGLCSVVSSEPSYKAVDCPAPTACPTFSTTCSGLGSSCGGGAGSCRPHVPDGNPVCESAFADAAPCSSDTDCPAAQVCIDAGGTNIYCAFPVPTAVIP